MLSFHAPDREEPGKISVNGQKRKKVGLSAARPVSGWGDDWYRGGAEEEI
jgi:hypothetical protein